jgi:hypothetical protein
MIACFMVVCAWGGITSEVKEVLAKMEALSRVRVPSDVPFAIYDPFARTEPLIERARPVEKHLPPPEIPHPSAILNGKAFVLGRWVRAGEKIGGYEILRVLPRGIWVREADKKIIFMPLREGPKILKKKDAG